MERYSVLLVDDEESVANIIMKKIDWDRLGYKVIGYANNGVKGLEMAQELEPDVVLTDIKMPFMDGMEMSRHIKNEFPATKIILFTGFDEFEYAKEAIHLEVEEYLLKPINAKELSQVLEKTKEKIDLEISEKKNIEVLQKYYEESLPVLREDFFSSLIQKKIKKEDIPGYIKQYKIDLKGDCFCLCVIHISEVKKMGELEDVLKAASVRKQIEERVSCKWSPIFFSYQENLNMLAQLKEPGDIIELTDECNRICKYVQRILGAVITIGLGNVCFHMEELGVSYSGARRAVSYRVLYGASQAIYINEIVPEEQTAQEETGNPELATLFKTIYFKSSEDIKKAVDQYMAYTLYPQTSLQRYQVNIMELISGIYRFMSNNGVFLEEMSENMGELYRKLTDMTRDELKVWMVHISLALSEKLVSVRNKNRKSYVVRAQNYIEHNYSDETLSLDTMCEILAVSNSYFSTVFKKETGKSFIEYLTDYRMEKASLMLLESDEKSYIIAGKVGYTDPNYFSYVFKKKFGVSPSKYRTEYDHVL